MLNRVEVLKSCFEKMLRIREAELLICREYKTDIFKTPTHLSIGAEAISVGFLSVYSKPRLYGTYRNHHWFLAQENSAINFFSEMLGKENSPSSGRAGSMHLINPQKGIILNSAIVASTISIAVGDAWAAHQANSGTQTICFFGDGAIEEGVFWESLNFAALKKIPITFICEDNDLAIHALRQNRQAFDFQKTVAAFGVELIQENGADIEKVIESATRAANISQIGPVVIELKYHRFLEHVGTSEDYHHNYRTVPDERNELWDPLEICKNRMRSSGIPNSELSTLQDKVRAEVELAFKTASSYADANPQNADKFVLRSR